MSSKGTRQVGKRIGGAIYIHRRYAQHPLVDSLKRHLPPGWDYTLVKIDERKGSVTFILSEDFDSADEPTMDGGILVRSDGTTAIIARQRDPYIYHHKWMMVEPSYPGFNYDESVRRSKLWESLDNIDRHRIGKRSYWERNVLPRLKAIL